jgi:catechol 2,3-dioxygenase-like lactoylglutathione lyase family enzyme
LTIVAFTTAGAIVNSGYGWLDLVSPGGIPFEIVVGAPRDPLMLVCLRVSSVADSVRFFTQKLGMHVLPFPLSRAPGSPFEPLPPAGAVFVSYGVDTMGLLLVPTDKNTGPIDTGNALEGFSIVVDDAARDLSEYVAEQMSAVRQLGRGGSRDGSARLRAEAPAQMSSAVVHSPDGYPFTLLPFSEFSVETRKA